VQNGGSSSSCCCCCCCSSAEWTCWWILATMLWETLQQTFRCVANQLCCVCICVAEVDGEQWQQCFGVVYEPDVPLWTTERRPGQDTAASWWLCAAAGAEEETTTSLHQHVVLRQHLTHSWFNMIVLNMYILSPAVCCFT